MSSSPPSAAARALLCLAACASMLLRAAPLQAAAGDGAESPPSRFKDPADGRFDASGFLDTAYGDGTRGWFGGNLPRETAACARSPRSATSI